MTGKFTVALERDAKYVNLAIVIEVRRSTEAVGLMVKAETNVMSLVSVD